MISADFKRLSVAISSQVICLWQSKYKVQNMVTDEFLLVLYYPFRQLYKKRLLLSLCLRYFRKPDATHILLWLWARSPSPLFCLQRDTGFSLAKELRHDPNYFSSYCHLLSLPNVPKQPCGPATFHFLTSLPDSTLANSLWYLPFQAYQLNQRL